MRHSQLSAHSGTSYPLFNSDIGGLSASAYSRNSRKSHYSRTRSVSPVNGNYLNSQQFNTFQHGKQVKRPSDA